MVQCKRFRPNIKLRSWNKTFKAPKLFRKNTNKKIDFLCVATKNNNCETRNVKNRTRNKTLNRMAAQIGPNVNVVPVAPWDGELTVSPRTGRFTVPAGSISVRPARRTHSSSTLRSIRSVACLILSSTDLKVSSTSGVSPNMDSLSVSCLDLSSIVSEELSNVCVPVSISPLINWGKTRRYRKIDICWEFCYSESIIKQGVKMYKSKSRLIVSMQAVS